MLGNKKYVQGDQNVQVPAHLNFGKFMLDSFKQRGEEIAIIHANTEEQMTYRELTQYIVNLSIGLRKLGVSHGDVVAFGSESRITFFPTALGVISSGAIFTSLCVKSGIAEVRHKIKMTQPKYFICSKAFWETYKDLLQEFEFIEQFIALDGSLPFETTIESLTEENVDVDDFEPATVKGQTDLALILYSSGTTAMPKGVKLTHLNCILTSLTREFEDESLRTAFVFGQWYHNYDIFMSSKFLGLGRKLIFNDDLTSTKNVLKSIDKYKANIAFVVPVVVFDLSKTDLSAYDVTSLKILYTRSAPLAAKTVEMVNNKFPSAKIVQGYGLTECGEPCSQNWAPDLRPGSVGKVSPGTTLKVVDPTTGEVLGPNMQGEIRIRGPVLLSGYIGIDPSTYLDEEGFFKTGDVGYYDNDEHFYIIDRIKECMIVFGFKIAPLELEATLLTHPGVREAGVVGKRVTEFEEQPTAFVVKKPGYDVTEQELVDLVAKELVATTKHLTGGVRFVESLPRSNRGKLLRRVLRETLNAS